MIEQKTQHHPLKTKQTVYYQDIDTGRQYKRILGAIAWPTVAFPGILGIMGETLGVDKTLGTRRIYLIAEATAPDASTLLAKCYDYTDMFLPSKWYGDDSNLPMIQILAKANEQVSDDEGLHIAPYRFLNDRYALEYYIALIRNRTKPGKKSLFFGQGSKLAAWLSQVAPEEVRKGKPSDYPAVMIVGGLLSVFERKPPNYSQMREAEEEILDALYTEEYI